MRLAIKPDAVRANGRQIELFGKTRGGSITEAEKAELKQLGMQRTAEVLDIRVGDLFSMTPVAAGMPDKARIETSTPCSRCGEPTMVSKLAPVDDQTVCRACLAEV